MNINWFTVIAQLINFLILVWLMRRFLYKPVLAAIDEREKKIAGQLADASAKKAEAEKEKADFEQKNEQFEQYKNGLMEKAVSETNVERKKIMDSAYADAELLRAKQKDALAKMEVNLNHQIEQKIRMEVFAISRKTLADLASVNLEDQLIARFVNLLHEMKAEDRKKFTDACNSGKDPVLVQSAFDLKQVQKTDIQNAVLAILGFPAQFQFKTRPEIISGIELSANGYKVGWSISDYLNSLEKSIADTIQEQTVTGAAKNQVPENKTEIKAV